MLSSKILRYLEKELVNATSETDLKNRQEVINYLYASKGECFGLATAWVYGRRISDEIDNKNNKPKDDIFFFNKVKKMLLEWDEKSVFGQEEKSDIERFISNVLLYQRFDIMLWKSRKIDNTIFQGHDQSDLSSILEDTKRGNIIENFREDSIHLTKKMLVDRFSNIVKPQTLILISLNGDENGHTMAIYQNNKDKKIYFYDSILDDEVEVDTLENLVELFWKSSNPQNFRKWHTREPSDSDIRNTAFRIFSFPVDKISKYPTKDEFKITETEFVDLFESSPYLLKWIRTDKEVQLFVDSLGDEQAMRILKSESAKDIIKEAIIVRTIINSEAKGSAILRYIFINYKDLIDDLKTNNYFTDQQLQSFLKIETKAFKIFPDNIDPWESRYEEEKVKNLELWLNLYENKLISQFDMQSLTLSEILYILENKPSDPSLAKNLLNYHQKIPFDSYINDVGFRLNLVILANLKNNSLETAKLILIKLGKDFGILPSMSSILSFNNEELALFMQENFGTASIYNTATGESYFPKLIADIKKRNTKIHNLKFAIERGDDPTVERFINGHDFDPNMDLGNGCTPVHVAAYSGRADLITKLSNKGADLNKKNKDNVSPIVTAILSGGENKDRISDYVNSVKALIDAGANIKDNFPDGMNLVIAAVESDNADVIPLLKKMGLDLNRTDNDGAPLLWHAASYTHYAGKINHPKSPHAFATLVAEGADLKQALKYAYDMHRQYGFYANEISLLENTAIKKGIVIDDLKKSHTSIDSQKLIEDDIYKSLRQLDCYAEMTKEQSELYLKDKQDGTYMIIPSFEKGLIQGNQIEIIYKKNKKIENLFIPNNKEKRILKLIDKHPDLIYPIDTKKKILDNKPSEELHLSVSSTDSNENTTVDQPRANNSAKFVQTTSSLFNNKKFRTDKKLEQQLLAQYKSQIEELNRFITPKYSESKYKEFLDLCKLAIFIKTSIKEFAFSMNYDLLFDHIKSIKLRLENEYKDQVKSNRDYKKFTKIVERVNEISEELAKKYNPFLANK